VLAGEPGTVDGPTGWRRAASGSLLTVLVALALALSLPAAWAAGALGGPGRTPAATLPAKAAVTELRDEDEGEGDAPA
jgi:hypothetical protein